MKTDFSAKADVEKTKVVKRRSGLLRLLLLWF